MYQIIVEKMYLYVYNESKICLCNPFDETVNSRFLKGYIFMRNFKNKSKVSINILKYLSVFILIIFCGVLYSCQRKDDSGIKIEQAGDEGNMLEQDIACSSSVNGNDKYYEEDKNVQGNEDVIGNQGLDNMQNMICVHIVGYVVNPGVYDVREGTRIYEIISLAGGFLPDADESYLNLASVVFDGQKIQVMSKEEAKTAKPFVGAEDNETSKKLININTATKEELMQLPGIGESRAISIISYRDKNGGFEKITDIMKISGIKEAAFDKIKDYICVE